MNSKLLSIIAVLIGILLPMKVSAQAGDYISAPEFTFEGDNIVMTCETQGANIYYVMSEFANEEEAYSLSEALDVSEANSMRTLYTQPFPVTSNVVIKAVAKMPQQQGESEVTTLIYSYTAWSGLLSAIEYGSKVQERAKDSPLVSDDLKEQLQWALEEGQMIYEHRGQMPDSHEAEHFAEEILQIAHEIEEILNQQPAGPEPYAVLSQNNTVLTFYYDTNRGAFQGSMDVTSTAWLDFKEQITTAVFDASFANYTTLTSTAFWFYECTNLTAITGFNNLKTDNVTNMDRMFAGCLKLTSLDLSSFNTANVTNMFMMFSGCTSLPSLNLSSFNTGKVTDMSFMFSDCSALTSLDLSNFNTVNVTEIREMFNGCSALTSLDLSNFNTINVTNMYNMFYNCSSLTSLDLSSFNITNVSNLQDMFKGCSSLTNIDLSNFNTANVTTMTGMFNGCSSLTNLDLSHFNTAQVNHMGNMFAGCSNLTSLNLSSFNTSQVVYMDGMFYDCSSLTSLDLSSFNTDHVISLGDMFTDCSGLTTIYVGQGWSTTAVGWDADMFIGCTNLVGGAGTTYNPDHVDHTYAHIDGGTANPGYFTAAGAEPWTEPEIEVVLTGKIDNFWYDETGNNPNGEEAVIFTIPETPDEGNFWDINVLGTFVNNQLTFTTPDGEALNNITGQILFETRGNMVALDDGHVLMYESGNEQEEIAFAEPGMGMLRIYNSNITQRLLHEPNAKYMALPVSVRAYLNNEEVTVQNGSFTVLLQIPQQAQEPEPYAVLSQNNTVLTFYYDDQKAARNGMGVGPFTISYDNDRDNVSSGWDAQRESITSVIFDSSFADCTTLTSTAYWFMDFNNLNTIIGISNLKTDNVTDMTAMFSGCSSLMSLDLSGFKTDNVTNMGSMLEWCRGLTSLDVTGFKTNNVTDMRQMFAGCSGLTSLDVTGFKTDNVTNMYAMFVSCSGLTSLDVTGFNTENVTDMGDMFSGCSGLTSLDVTGFKTDNVTSMRWMFADCRGLTSLDLTGFKTDNVTNMAKMFGDCQSLTSLDVTGFKTDNVTSMYAMFAGCSSLTSLGLTGFKTDNVTDMGLMFYGCSGLTGLDLTGFKTDNVTGMRQMFAGCSSLTTIYAGNGWSTAKVQDGEDMFTGCISLVGGAGTRYDPNHIDHTYAHIDGGENNPGYFTAAGAEPWTDEELELYAVLSRNNTVLTFYYDDQIEERGGISVDDESWERRELELTSSIVALVFDESFSDFVVNDSEGFSINLDGWTSLAAVKAGSVRIPAEEYAKVGNPNLLVYVNEPSLAPQGVQNVVINGVAQEIILTDVTEGNNNWHCPEPFRAEKITYTRNFRQQTEVGISRGWESIALPFTVQTITHETQGQIIPFGAQGTGKYFWLRGYSPDGLHRATVLEANTPYVISMPNNPTVYPAQYNLNGRVTFSAENTTVPATPEFEEMLITRGNITMAPIFVVVPQDEAVYAINVSQPLDRYAEGSVFTRELREVRPFEAATTHEPVNGARPKNIRIAAQPDDDITGIRTIELDETEGTWYSLDGRQMQGQPQRKGVYLQKGKKIVVK